MGMRAGVRGLLLGFPPGASGASAPVNTSAPAVEGDALVGAELSVTPGTWTDDPTLTYQWQRYVSEVWSAISGATETAYTVTPEDTGYTLRVVETANGSFSAPSAATDTVRLIISSAAITPTLEPELVVNGSMESDDPPASWTAVNNATLDGVADERTGGAGAQSLAIIHNGTGSPEARQSVSIPTNTWFQAAAWIRRVDSDLAVLRVMNNALSDNLIAQVVVTSTSWAQYIGTGRVTSAGVVVRLVAYLGILGRSSRFDDISLRALTLSSLFGWDSGKAVPFVPGVIRAKVTLASRTQAGIAHYSDDDNFVLAYLDGAGNVVLLKRVGGSYTPVGTAAITYSAGALLELHYDSTAKAYSVYYNDSATPKINAASVTDAVFVDAVETRYFSTSPNTAFADIEVIRPL